MISFYFTESDNDIQNSQLCVRAASGNTLNKSSDNIQNVTGYKGQEGDKCHASGRNVLWKTEKGCSFAVCDKNISTEMLNIHKTGSYGMLVSHST